MVKGAKQVWLPTFVRKGINSMAVLSEDQLSKTYFDIIGGFPPAKILKEFKDYNGEEQICVACTQLDSHYDYLGYSKSDLKRIQREWVSFFTSNTSKIKSLHFNSRVPQELFDASCCQENLEELRFKWGSYSNLSSLRNLCNLKFLYIGQGSSIQDISILGKINSLVVLHIEGFKKIEDFSPLAILDNLEQLVIIGPMLGRSPVKDLEFLREMPNLRSAFIGNVIFRRKYTPEELFNLRASMPNLHLVVTGN